MHALSKRFIFVIFVTESPKTKIEPTKIETVAIGYYDDVHAQGMQRK